MTVMEQDITAYVERIRAALADLPPTLRDELTEDLPEHLAEVAAEGGGSLVERLGEPEAYAAELRAAAGAPVTTGPNLDQRLAGAVLGIRTRLRTLDDRLGPTLGYPRASEFLRLLRPAWWLLRGYLAAMLVTVLSSGERHGLLPRVGGSSGAGLVLLVGCVLASLWLGRNAQRLSRWPRRLVLGGSLGLAFFGLVNVFVVDDYARWGNYGYDPVPVGDQYSHIEDVFVYDSEGRLVRDARLFDQNGTPIRLGWPNCLESPGVESDADVLRRPYPYCPDQAPFQLRPPGTSPAPTGSGTPPVTPAPPATPAPTATPTAAPAPTTPAPTAS